MRDNRRQGFPVTFRSTGSTVIIESRFPAAVVGEDYDRFRKAVWRQGERWFTRNEHRVARASIVQHEAREILHALAVRDLDRQLHHQEERLLSDLIQQQWPGIERWPDDAEPEIPAFLVPSTAAD